MELVLVVNVIGMLSTGVTAGMYFSDNKTGSGIAMVCLFAINLICFVINLWRLFR